MSKGLKKVAGIALPIIGNLVAPGIGGIIGSAAGGLASGGGLKAALLGAGTSALTGGLGSALGKAGTAINWTSAAPGYATGLQTVGGTGLLGGLSRAVNSSGFGQSLVQGASKLVNTGFGGGPGMSGAAVDGVGEVAGNAAGNVAGAGVNSAGGALSGAAGGTAANGVLSGLPSIGSLATTALSAYQKDQELKEIEKQQLAANQQALDVYSPFAQTGVAANNQLSSLLGLGEGGNAEALNTLRDTPGYEFQLGQGQQAIDRAQSARGNYFSGEALKAGQEYGQGLADQMYSRQVQNLAQQSGQGVNVAGNQAALYGTGGDIRANTTASRSNNLAETLAELLKRQQGQ